MHSVADDLEMAAKVEPLRELIGILCDELKLRHIAETSAPENAR